YFFMVLHPCELGFGRNTMSYDEFDHANCMDKCVIEIDGKHFDVSSTILSSRSNYFYHAFMNKSFIESQSQEGTQSAILHPSHQGIRNCLRIQPRENQGTSEEDAPACEVPHVLEGSQQHHAAP
ncbi:hypothetical protein PENTCL1PPCAC_2301, partial [Pristionchus entomophagus]